jgi:preprotein translocase subunit SecB
MKESILQLKDYFITRTLVEFNAEFKLDKPTSLLVDDLTVKISSTMLRNPETDEEVFKVDLDVAVKEDRMAACNLPYYFSISSIGIFALDESCSKDREKVAVINGASILFSSIREYLAGITGHGPFSRIVLPTADLRSLEKNSIPKASPKPKIKKKKTKKSD